MFRVSLILRPLLLASAAEAYTIFDTKCSTPNVTTSFVSAPDTRGTLDILWSCLFTIIACTWTIQHLNVPEQREGKDPGWRGDLKWKLKGFGTSLTWMLITAIAPEVFIGQNLEDLRAARINFPILKEMADKDKVPWTLTHTLFADMGGFVIRSQMGDKENEKKAVKDEMGEAQVPTENMSSPKTIEIFEAISSSNSQPKPRDEGLESTISISESAMSQLPQSPRYHNPFHLTSSAIIDLRNDGTIPRLPSITQDEIDDKSKSDMFARLIAIGQISWVLIQVIARGARGLKISQLEIAVVAFSVCAIVIYALNWKKPKGVQVPVTILSYDQDIPQKVLQGHLNQVLFTKSIISELLGLGKTDRAYSIGKAHATQLRLKGAPIPQDSTASSAGASNNVKGQNFGLIIGCVCFGGIHISAWNFVFPTTAERIIWRANSLWSTVYILSQFSIGYILWPFGLSRYLIHKILGMLTILYVLARLFLLVEIFRTLCFLPPSVYVATWASNIPHLGG